ncbi:MAG TPA: hypothetical protein VFE05_05405 [Longimicrobiaceae bacterium]|jgi:hypothetical protein|nr:hypothetical protein [Longimicrobiaceae bacterium]
MSLQELETEALKLPESERAVLAERILASLAAGSAPLADDPVFGLGRAPVSCGAPRASVEHDRYLYGSEDA